MDDARRAAAIDATERAAACAAAALGAVAAVRSITAMLACGRTVADDAAAAEAERVAAALARKNSERVAAEAERAAAEADKAALYLSADPRGGGPSRSAPPPGEGAVINAARKAAGEARKAAGEARKAAMACRPPTRMPRQGQELTSPVQCPPV